MKGRQHGGLGSGAGVAAPGCGAPRAPSRRGAGGDRGVPAHGDPGRHHREHRPAPDPAGPRLLHHRPVVGAERLHPDLRRAPAAGGPGRRHPRPPPGVHRRDPDLHPGLVPRRPGHLGGLAAGRPRPPGGRRRHRRADRPGPDHHQLRRRPRAQPRLRGVRGGGRGRRGPRPARRRHAHLVAVVALGAVRQRAHRRPAGRAGAAVHHRVRAPSGPLRPGRRPHLHRRDDRPGLRLHQRRPRRLEQPDHRRVLHRRRGPAGRLPLDRDQDPPAHHPPAPVRDRNRAGSYAIMLALAAAMFGMFFFLTLFVQDVLGYSPLRAGLSFLPSPPGSSSPPSSPPGPCPGSAQGA